MAKLEGTIIDSGSLDFCLDLSDPTNREIILNGPTKEDIADYMRDLQRDTIQPLDEILDEVAGDSTQPTTGTQD